MASGPVTFEELFGPTGPGRQELDELVKSVAALSRSVKVLGKNLDSDGQRIAAGLAAIKDQTSGLREQAATLSQAALAEGTNLRTLSVQVAELAKQQQQLQLAEAGAAKAKQLVQDATTSYTAELKKQRDALREAYAANDTQGIVKAAKAIQTLKNESEDLNRALRGANSSYTAAAGSFRAMENEARSLDAQLKALGNGMEADSAEAQQLKARLAEVNQSMISFTRDVNQGYKNVGRYAESIIEAVGALEKQKAALLANAQALTTQARVTDLSADEQQKLQTEIKQTENQLNKVNGELRGYGVGMQENAAPAGDFIAKLAGVYYALQNVSAAFEKVFSDNVEYSDAAVGVRKTTGQTAAEFDILRDKLDALDSRTGLKGLLDEAAIGGELGTAKDKIADFVEGLDVSVQALADDFDGNVELIAKSLGKINTVFGKQLGGDLKTNLINIGSAINELGAVGAATSPNLADVALRTGAVAANAKLGLGDVLGYAAVLEELGFTSEVSGTSLNRLFNTLSSRREEAFKIAKLGDSTLTLKSFTKLINTDFKGALDVFLKGLNAGGTTTTKFNDLLGTLKLQSGAAKDVITSLAKNTELVAERQATANEQLRVGTSVTAEASLKTNNLAGSWEKLKKAISSTVVGSAVGGIFKDIIDGANRLLAMGNDKKLQDAKSREIQLSGEQIGANLRTANSARDLLARYEELTAAHTALQAKGQRPTLQQTRELDLITLKLRDSLGDSIGKINQQTGAFELNTGAVKEAIQARLLLSNQTASTAFLRLDKLGQDEKTQKAVVADLKSTLALRKQEVEATGVSLERAKELFTLSAEREAEGKGKLRGYDFTSIDKYTESERQLSLATNKLTAIQQLKAQQQKVLNDLGLKDVAAKAGQVTAAKKLTDAELEGADADDKKKKSVADLAKEEFELQKQRLQNRITDLDRQADNPANTEAIRNDAIRKGIEARKALVKLELNEGIREAIQANKDKINGDQAAAIARVRLTEKFRDQIIEINRTGDKKQIALAYALLDQLGELDKLSIEQEITTAEKVRDTTTNAYEVRQQAARETADLQIELATITRDTEIRAAVGAKDKIQLANAKFRAAEQKANDSVKPFDSLKAIDEQDASYGRILLGLEGLHGKKLVSEKNYLHQVRDLENQREAEAIAALEREYGATAEVLARKLALQRKVNSEATADEEQAQQRRQEIVAASFQALQSLSDAFFQQGSSQRAAEQDAIQAQRDHDLAVAGENAELKAQIEEQFQKRSLELRREQARQEKQHAIFSIILNTAQAVMSALAQFPGPVGIALAAAAGAVGVVQLREAYSQPLPAYFKGRENGPAELAVVAERGPELIGQPGSFRLAAREGITHLAKGDRVFTAPETRDVLRDHELIAGRLVARQQQQDQIAQASALRGVSPGYSANAAAEARAFYASRHDTDRLVAASKDIKKAIEGLPLTVIEEDGIFRYVRNQNTVTKLMNSRYKKDH